MLKQLPVLSIFIFSFHFGFAQDSTAIHYAEKITPADTRPFLEVLTSDSLEGRETGKPGQKKATAFIAAHFQSLGLKPLVHGGYVQHTSLSPYANRGKNFQVNGKYFLFMRDYFYPTGFADSLFVITKIFFAGNGLDIQKLNNYKGIEVKNEAVFFFEKNPVSKKTGGIVLPGVTQKIKTAEEKGASVILVITDSLDKVVEEYSYGKGLEIKSKTPYVFITPQMAKAIFPEGKTRIFDKAKNGSGKSKGKEISTDAQLAFVRNTESMRGENVLGFLEGTDKKEEVLVLTAHYDHLGIRDSMIHHGADDDGSGTTAVMEMAKQFSLAAKEGHRPRRSILFMTVSGEEKGLLGSKYYVRHPIVPLANTIVNLNTDMIGRTDEKHDSLNVREYVYIIGSDKLSTTLHAINESVNKGFTKLELDYTFNRPDDPNRFYYRSDHYNFAKNKIPVIFYFNGTHADYHKPSDTIDKIQFDLLAKRTQLIFLTAWDLANREERIKVDVESDMPDKKEE